MFAKNFRNAVQPYESKVSFPITKVKVTNTPFTVKSLGIAQTLYRLDDTNVPDFASQSNLTLVGTGVTPVLSFYTDVGGQPVGFRAGDHVAIQYTGWFYTGTNSGSTDFRFKAVGPGNNKVNLRVNGSDIFSGGQGLYMETNRWTRKPADDASPNGDIVLPADSWVEFEFRYFSRADEKGICLLWKDQTMDEFLPLSAGVANTVPGFQTEKELNYVTKASGINSRGDATAFDFEVPLVDPDNTLNGYYFHKNSQRYYAADDATKSFRKHELVEVEFGYKADLKAFFSDNAGERIYVDTTDQTNMEWGTEDIICEFWFKASEVSGTEELIRHNASSGTAGFRVRLLSTGKLQFTIRDGTVEKVATTTAEYDDDTWRHVACVFDRSETTGIEVWVDGEEAAYDTQDDATDVAFSITPSSQVFFICSDSGGTTDRAMAEVRTYKFGVNGLPSEYEDIIKHSYSQPGRVSHIAESYLVSRHTMQDLSGTKVKDSSGNANHATFAGGAAAATNLRFAEYGASHLDAQRTSDSQYDDTIKVFIGHIKRFELIRKPEGNDVIKAHCESFESFLKESINLNYPDILDYWHTDMVGGEWDANNPDSIDYPPTFDGWNIKKAVQSLLIRGTIDPLLTEKKKKFLDNSGTEVEAGLLMEESNPPVMMEKAKDYGRSAISFRTDGVDDEYRLETNFGDKLFDYINKVTDPYVWDWGSTAFQDGAFYFRPRNNPTEIITTSTGDTTFTGSWSNEMYDLDAISGTFRETTTANDYIDSTFQGERVDVIVSLSSDATDAGSMGYVVSGSADQVQLEDVVGNGFTVNNRVIFEMPDGDESVVLDSNPQGSDWTLSPNLSAVAPARTRVRTAVAKATVTEGSSYDATKVKATRYIPSYYPAGLNKTIQREVVWENPAGSKIEETIIVSGARRFYYHGFDPEKATNPCQFNVANNLNREDHTIRVERLTNDEADSSNTFTFNSLFVFDEDWVNPDFTYYTDDTLASGTLIDLSVKDTGEDERNDVTVVGKQLGAVVPGGAYNESAVNPNNPSMRYVISRAVDVNAIIASGASNFVGRPLQTILIEPGISSQERADYWAVSFLNEFRFAEKTGRFKAIGNPLLDIGDPVYVNDIYKDSIDVDTTLWIESLAHDWKGDSTTTTFDVSSAPPASSFQPKVPVDPNDFGSYPVRNIEISNGTDSGSPYDPYEADSDGKFIEITFDLIESGWLRVEVFGIDENPYLGPFITKVADLINPEGEETDRGWGRATFGTKKKLIWDGVDQVGRWNTRYLELDDNQHPENYFASEPITNSDGTLASYGQFFLVFTLQTGGKSLKRYSTHESPLIPGQSTTIQQQYIYTKRGAVVSPTIVFDPVFGKGTSSTPPSGFTVNSNDSKGLKVTLTTDKPAQYRARFIHDTWGEKVFNYNARNRRRGKAQFDVTWSRTEFIQYDSHDEYFHPVDALNVFFDDWVTAFDEPPFSQEERDLGARDYIGHYFLIELYITDKSGRTVKNISGHFWDSADATLERRSAGISGYVPDDGDFPNSVDIGVIWGVDIYG